VACQWVHSTQSIEPQTNYSVVRLQQDLRGGNSGIGVMLTNTARRTDQWTRDYLRGNALTGGLDARHRFWKNNWQLSGQLAASQVTGAATAIARTQRSNVHLYQRTDADHLDLDTTRTSLGGWMTQASLDKQGGGIVRANVGIWRSSAGFEINDIGFKARADEQGASAWMGLRPTKPFGPFRQGQLNFNAYAVGNTVGTPLANGGNMNGWGEFKNQWSAYSGLSLNNLVATYSDRDTRGGPLIRKPAQVSMWSGINGDQRKALQPSVGLNASRRFDGRGYDWNVNTSLRYRVASRLNGNVSLSYSRNLDDQQWYGNFVDSATTNYTFARLNQTTTSLTVRLNYTFTPRLSFESYAQPFVSSGSYTNWRSLSNGRADAYGERFAGYTVRGNPEGFRFGQLRTNNVLRWEYRPGSTLFFVWTQGRDSFDNDPASYSVGKTWNSLFTQRPDNVFLVKASYWFGR
jgi:Domain of unknown function (DUF5916)